MTLRTDRQRTLGQRTLTQQEVDHGHQGQHSSIQVADLTATDKDNRYNHLIVKAMRQETAIIGTVHGHDRYGPILNARLRTNHQHLV